MPLIMVGPGESCVLSGEGEANALESSKLPPSGDWSGSESPASGEDLADSDPVSADHGQPPAPSESDAAPVRKRRASLTRAVRQRAVRGLPSGTVADAWVQEFDAKHPQVASLAPLPYRPTHFVEAYDLTAAERAALDKRALRRANVNSGNVVDRVLALVPFLDRWREAIWRVPVDHAAIDRIDTYARAFSHSDTAAATTLEPAPPPLVSAPEDAPVFTAKERLRKLLGIVIETRRVLLSDARNLVVQGAIQAAALRGLKGRGGYHAVALDVLMLVNLIRDAEPEVRALSTQKDEALEHATKDAQDLIESAARTSTKARDAAQSLAYEDRARAFTLLWYAYQEAQRALAFILWHSKRGRDVLPTLMVGVGRKKGTQRSPE